MFFARSRFQDHSILRSRSMSNQPADFAIAPPIEPMLAKLADALPDAGPFLFEPKWDGFRAIVFRGSSDVFIQSRDLRPLDRSFPELPATLLESLPPRPPRPPPLPPPPPRRGWFCVEISPPPPPPRPFFWGPASPVFIRLRL